MTPQNWDAKRVKHVSHLVTSGSRGWAEFYADDGPLFIRIGNLTERGIDLDLADLQHVQVPAGAEGARTRVKQGDVLVSITALIGAVGLVRNAIGESYVNQHLALVRPTSLIDARWLAYVLRSQLGRDQFMLRMYGGTKVGLGLDDVREVAVPLPPLHVQRVLANLLDRKTAAIDTLIAKKERLTELLQEKRQALITQAVTKGLDPNVPMKESGVEWLGAIPAHWTAQKLRHRIRRIEQGWSPSCENSEAEEGEWGVLKVGCVNYGGFRDSENKALPLDLKPLPELEVRMGDVLVSRANTRELVGSAAYVERTRSRLLLCDKLFRIHYRASDTDPRFLVLLLQSDLCRFQFEREATGASGSMQNIGQDSVRRLLFGWAPLEEQRQIVRNVGATTARLDTLKSRLEAHIEKLREYRQALITAAVTGKIDVSKEAA